VAVLAALLAGCSNGDEVTGVVEAPNGEIAAASPGLWRRFADLIVARAVALTGLDPVPPGVAVALSSIQDIIEGCGLTLDLLQTVPTFAAGTYVHPLATNENPGSSLILSVGNPSDDTLMRAFVYGQDVDINPASEATVRLVLQAVCENDYPLGNYTASALQTSIGESGDSQRRPATQSPRRTTPPKKRRPTSDVVATIRASRKRGGWAVGSASLGIIRLPFGLCCRAERVSGRFSAGAAGDRGLPPSPRLYVPVHIVMPMAASHRGPSLLEIACAGKCRSLQRFFLVASARVCRPADGLRYVRKRLDLSRDRCRTVSWTVLIGVPPLRAVRRDARHPLGQCRCSAPLCRLPLRRYPLNGDYYEWAPSWCRARLCGYRRCARIGGAATMSFGWYRR
jgi:hypothetical protein